MPPNIKNVDFVVYARFLKHHKVLRKRNLGTG